MKAITRGMIPECNPRAAGKREARVKMMYYILEMGLAV
jgi:hypothetical protein